MQFKHIAFPIMCGDTENTAKRDLERLARRFGSRVSLLKVFQSYNSYADIERAFSDASAYLSTSHNARRLLNFYDVDVPSEHVQRVLLEGDPASEITQWVNDNMVDLVVLGAANGVHIGDCLIGSAATRLMHDSACNIWFGGFEGESKLYASDSQPARIVCGLGLDEEAVALLKFADELGHGFGAEVAVVHSIAAPLDVIEKDMDREEIEREQTVAGTHYPVRLSHQGIANAVTQTAGSEHADLIVIGRGHSQNHLGSLWTHAYSTIRHAPCPVLSHCCKAREQRAVAVESNALAAAAR